MNKPTTENVNHSYFAHYLKQIPGWASLRVLDFGCGAGEIVSLLRREGIKSFGVDVFYDGASYEGVYKSALFQDRVIRAIPDSGKIPFDDGFFDVIISNQVLEHIKDKDSVLKELKRVLSDEGFMYHHFPTRDSIREGHMGIPFAHWLPKGRFRFIYTVLLRCAGFGYYKGQLSLTDWAQRQLDWIDTYCYYEKWAALEKRLSKEYIISQREIDYCRFRSKNSKALRTLLRPNFLTVFYRPFFRRLGLVAIELRKRAPSEGITRT